MSFLYFELNEPAETQKQYLAWMELYGSGLQKSAQYLLRAIQLMLANETREGQYRDTVVLLLSRHVAEEVDAASVLVKAGCIDPCKSHLRSAFEAELGIRYVLEKNSEQRALAYLVKHIYERIRFYDKLDPNSQSGKQMRKEIKKDEATIAILSSLPELGIDEARMELRDMLRRPPFDIADSEWKRVKKKQNGRPNWYTLFDGPQDARKLAIYLDRGGWYDFLYSDWSGHIHAGSTAFNVGRNESEDSASKNLKPLRHPEDVKDVYCFGRGIAIPVARLIADHYLSDVGKDDLQSFFGTEIKPINEKLNGITIKADWK